MSLRSDRQQPQQQRQRGRRTSFSSAGGSGSLNQRMRSARSAAELLDLLGHQDISSLSLIDASTAVHVLARQRPVSASNAKYGTTAAALMRHVEEHTVPKLTNGRTILTLLWAVAKLQDSTGDSLKSSALECLSLKGLEMLDTCDGRGVATVAWSVVQLRKSAPSLAENDVTFAVQRGITRLLCESDHAHAFDAHSLATIAWACGALRCRDRALLHKLGDHALSRLGEFTTQGLQNIVTALAKCGYSVHGELLKALKASFLQRISEFDAQGLSAFSWAFQKLQPGQNVDLVLASAQALCATADQRKGGVGAAAESVTQSLLAVATLLAAPNTRPRRLYAKFRPVVLELLLRCEQAQRDMSFDMPQISTTISSFAKLVGCVGLFEETAEWCTRRAKLTEQLKNGLLRVLRQSQAQDLAIVLWGLGRLHGCSKNRENTVKSTLFAPVEAVQVLQSVQRQLLSFNWRSMGLMDYAIPQLLTGSLVDSTATTRATIEEWEHLRQEVEGQRRKRASALMTELHYASEAVAKQPWALTLDALSGRCTQRSVNLLAALLAPRVPVNVPQKLVSKCRVLLFDDNTGEVGSTVRLLAAEHASIEIELSGCMRYASACNRVECSPDTGSRSEATTEKVNSEVRWNMPWSEWEQRMRVEDEDTAMHHRESDQRGSTRFDCCLMRYPGTFGRDSSESFAMALAAVACRLPVGAPLLLCGLLEETVTSGVGGGSAADTARLKPGSATEPKLPSSLRNCLNKWFTAASIIEHRHGTDTCGGAVLVRAARNSSCCPVISGRIAAWATDTTHPLQSHAGPGVAKGVGWRTFPGLFSGGTLSEMTQSLLDHIPTPPSGATVLDFACGSGIIGAALLQKQPSIALHMLDADSVATEAVRRNVGSAYAVHLSDGWASVDSSLRFDFIVSNPPVHSGLGDDMEVVKGLVQGAAPRALGGGGRLKPGGILCLVTQTQIPTGCILHANGFEESQRNFVDCEAGHFLVWTATVGHSAASQGGDSEHAQRAARLLQHGTQSTEFQAGKEDEKVKQSRNHSAKQWRANTGKDHQDLALAAQKQVMQNHSSESQLQQLLHRGDVAELTAAKLAAASAEDYKRAALLKRHIEALQESEQAASTDSAAAPKLARKRKRKEKQKGRKRAAVGL